MVRFRRPYCRSALSGLLLTFLAVILSGLGARDQAIVAALAERQGQRPGLLIVALLCGAATAALAAWAGSTMLPMLVPKARAILAALALAFAGAEQLLLGGRRKPEEPTLSLGATGIVILAHQATDAARFLIFAIAVAANAPVAAGVAGAVGGSVLLAVGWAAPQAIGHPRARLARRLIGAALVLVAGFVALRAFGRI